MLSIFKSFFKKDQSINEKESNIERNKENEQINEQINEIEVFKPASYFLQNKPIPFTYKEVENISSDDCDEPETNGYITFEDEAEKNNEEEEEEEVSSHNSLGLNLVVNQRKIESDIESPIPTPKTKGFIKFNDDTNNKIDEEKFHYWIKNDLKVKYEQNHDKKESTKILKNYQSGDSFQGSSNARKTVVFGPRKDEQIASEENKIYSSSRPKSSILKSTNKKNVEKNIIDSSTKNENQQTDHNDRIFDISDDNSNASSSESSDLLEVSNYPIESSASLSFHQNFSDTSSHDYSDKNSKNKTEMIFFSNMKIDDSEKNNRKAHSTINSFHQNFNDDTSFFSNLKQNEDKNKNHPFLTPKQNEFSHNNMDNLFFYSPLSKKENQRASMTSKFQPRQLSKDNFDEEENLTFNKQKTRIASQFKK